MPAPPATSPSWWTVLDGGSPNGFNVDMYAFKLVSARRKPQPHRSIGAAVAEVSASAVDRPAEDVVDALREALHRRGCEVPAEQITQWALQIVGGHAPRVAMR